MTVRIIAVLLLCLAAAAPAGAAPRIGVYMHDEDAMGARPEAQTLVAAAAGADHVRADFLWRGIEPARGDFRWESTDRMMEATARAGIDLMPTLLGTPSWASSVPEDAFVPGVFPPRENRDFAAFASALARRYGPGGTYWASHPGVPVRPVRTWQIWNEPNLPAFWRPAPNPYAYAALLDAAATAIRGVDAGAEIVAAGLPESALAMPAAQFLSGMYAAGAAKSFDTLAVHPYAPEAATVVAVVESIRRVADRNSDDAPIRVTEFGWATAGEESLLTVGEETQARLVRESIVALRAAESRLRLKGLVYFKWHDHPRPFGARDIWPYHAGLVRQDGTAKPALVAFAEAVRAPLPREPEPATRKEAEQRLQPLDLRMRVPRQSARRVRRSGLKVRVGCSRACTLQAVVSLERRLKLTSRRIVLRRERALRDARARTITLKVPAAAVRAARRPGGRLVVRLAATAVGGAATALAPVRVALNR